MLEYMRGSLVHLLKVLEPNESLRECYQLEYAAY
jgi:hypothetical protein